jgi:hypothetical protein
VPGPKARHVDRHGTTCSHMASPVQPCTPHDLTPSPPQPPISQLSLSLALDLLAPSLSPTWRFGDSHLGDSAPPSRRRPDPATSAPLASVPDAGDLDPPAPLYPNPYPIPSLSVNYVSSCCRLVLPSGPPPLAVVSGMVICSRLWCGDPF